MPTFNKDNHSLETDIKGDAVDLGLAPGETMNTTKKGGTNAYNPDAGLHNYFQTHTTHNAPEKYWDSTQNSGNGGHTIDSEDTTHTSRQTQTATVITMNEWKTTYNSQNGDYWVIDTDGWCYWANPIAPETATGLLLTHVILEEEPENKWYYSIYVKSQMATAQDWMETTENQGFYQDPAEAPSQNAKALLTQITTPEQ